MKKGNYPVIPIYAATGWNTTTPQWKKVPALQIPGTHTHKSTNRPPFGTWGSLNFDIPIASYTITPFSFFFYLFYAINISVGKVTVGALYPSSSGGYWQIRWACTGGPICLATFLFSSPRVPRATIGSTGGDTVQFLMVRVPRVGGGGGIE